jgi:hypothetical protein
MNRTVVAGAVLLIAFVAACGQHRPPGPPTSQQQAQDTVLGYLKKTLQALPSGTVFDHARYAGSGNTPCNDEPTGVPPNEFSDIRDAIFPPETYVSAMIAKTGEIWQSRGWYVRERDEFPKPNRFGDAPDGYSLQIVAARHNGNPPTITGVSSCFPGELVRDDIRVPAVLKADS